MDEDHIDQETGQHVVRRERQGLTNSYGFWTRTVTYDGAGEYACDKVIFEVWWVESRLYYGDARLDKNAASATVSVRMP